MAQPVLAKVFLQPAKTAAIHDYAHPPPPIPPILLAQNLSSKWIVPTNNTQLKLHDKYLISS